MQVKRKIKRKTRQVYIANDKEQRNRNTNETYTNTRKGETNKGKETETKKDEEKGKETEKEGKIVCTLLHYIIYWELPLVDLLIADAQDLIY